MPYAITTPVLTFEFLGLIGCLILTSIALIWSIEDQKAKKLQHQKQQRRVKKD